MKCPKCGYIGFEAVDRCRNCGYDFSLAMVPQVPDLPIRDSRAPSENPLDDFALIDAAVDAAQASPGSFEPSLDRAAPAASFSGRGLPLGDEPLITKPSPPRAPLAVRRATPEVPRVRTPGRTPMLDLSQGSESDAAAGANTSAHSWPGDALDFEPAPLASRALAMAVDVAILLAIDALVVYFTMQICGLTPDDFSVLPKAPLVAFLVVQNGGYLVAFTAGGQTLGKMVAGIRIVPDRSDAPIDLGRSILRTSMWVVLAVPAGLGFLTALSRDHRGLHDRFAGTRVVRASA
jgi:uncharacterized RDD family membrane protein YckC